MILQPKMLDFADTLLTVIYKQCDIDVSCGLFAMKLQKLQAKEIQFFDLPMTSFNKKHFILRLYKGKYSN